MNPLDAFQNELETKDMILKQACPFSLEEHVVLFYLNYWLLLEFSGKQWQLVHANLHEGNSLVHCLVPIVGL